MPKRAITPSIYKFIYGGYLSIAIQMFGATFLANWEKDHCNCSVAFKIIIFFGVINTNGMGVS